MIYFDYVPYNLSKTDRKVKITCNFENVNSSDVFRCFLWEDFSTQVPMIHYVDVE